MNPPTPSNCLTAAAPVLLQKQRGLVQQQARQQGVWDREAWPRAAWYVRGLGW